MEKTGRRGPHPRHTSEEFKSSKEKVRGRIVNFVRKTQVRNQEVKSREFQKKAGQEEMLGGKRNMLPFFLSTLGMHSLSPPIFPHVQGCFLSMAEIFLMENLPHEKFPKDTSGKMDLQYCVNLT